MEAGNRQGNGTSSILLRSEQLSYASGIFTYLKSNNKKEAFIYIQMKIAGLTFIVRSCDSTVIGRKQPALLLSCSSATLCSNPHNYLWTVLL